jgi:hypothetical protein
VNNDKSKRLTVFLKAETDLLRTFGLSSVSHAQANPTSHDSLFDFVVEPHARIEVFAQQLESEVLEQSGGGWKSRAAGSDIDVVVLSLAGDLTRQLYRDPSSDELMDPVDRSELAVDVEAVPGDFEKAASLVVERLQASGTTLVVWFMASTVNGRPEPHRWTGADRPFSSRANRLNLAVARLSQQRGAAFVDADRILAELGAASHVEGPCLYSEEASLLLLQEFRRILVESGTHDAVAVGSDSRGSY